MQLRNDYSLIECKVTRNTDILYGDIQRIKNKIAKESGHYPDDIVITSKKPFGKFGVRFEYEPVYY